MTFTSLHEYIKVKCADDYDLLQSSITAKNLITSFPTKTKSPCLNSDWVCDISEYKEHTKRLTVSNFCVCVIPDEQWVKNVTQVERNVFMQTGYKEYMWLVDSTDMKVEIDHKICTVWIGEICKLKDVINNTGLRYLLTKEDKLLIASSNTSKMPKIATLNARCEKSMYMFDEIHRKYIDKKDFKKHDVVAVKSVAGSGKTTTLLNLAKYKPNAKILYMAFNKSLINEIKSKIKTHKINNLIPCTFDSLMYRLYTFQGKSIDKISSLNPYLLSDLGLMSKHNYGNKKQVCDLFEDFCANVEYKDIHSYCSNKLNNIVERSRNEYVNVLKVLWDKAENGSIITFNTMRKLAYVHGWCDPFLDTNYEMIMIDETQDFDLMMLKMILNNTTIPKLFVGDPNQSIYQFRGNIDAFDYMPSTAEVIEFYSTFRVGNPACKQIAEQIPNCWKISKSDHNTKLVSSFSSNCSKYTYLFRTWRSLLLSASQIHGVWINNYESKKTEICKMHKRNRNMKSDPNVEDADLPKFIKSMTSKELESLFDAVEENLVSYDSSCVKCYTVHSYKGLEDNYVRISSDILADQDMLAKSENAQERNLYYVAITRGQIETRTTTERKNTSITINVPTTKPPVETLQSETEHNMLVFMLENWLASKSKKLFKAKHEILTIKNVEDIIKYKPKTLLELQAIRGIGIIKLKAYGKEILNIIQSASVHS